ncbi:CPBP family intramembrane glutamic endopeptidase [Roseovarius sp. Pro17]|uniref:CPBP family intramembrane glutamic endopeptidase n=1 Tax=Roseovarius sp. Pro17 TaxID=3108175 RepID=UPI002D76D93D|nr:CPBP family intramembrane glutamic endopeptidase [Roseovarius sp. Pro17]
MRYPAYRPLVDPARATAPPWRLLVGIVLTVALFLVLSLVYGWLCTTFLPRSTWGEDGRGIEEATTAGGALVNLYAFGLLTLALAAILPLMHKRSLVSLIGAAGLAAGQAGRVILYMVGVYIAASLVQLLDPIPMQPSLAFVDWLPILPLTLAGLIIQTSAEELMFRGYIQSQLAARFRHPAIWMGIPAVMFGMLHYQPGTMGDASWLIVIWAILFGIAAADLTARSGTLGPAIALHLVNNFSAIALVAPAGYFDGLALATYPFGPDDTALLLQWMPMDLAVLLCSYLAARLALRV